MPYFQKLILEPASSDQVSSPSSHDIFSQQFRKLYSWYILASIISSASWWMHKRKRRCWALDLDKYSYSLVRIWDLDISKIDYLLIWCRGLYRGIAFDGADDIAEPMDFTCSSNRCIYQIGGSVLRTWWSTSCRVWSAYESIYGNTSQSNYIWLRNILIYLHILLYHRDQILNIMPKVIRIKNSISYFG